MGRNITLRLSEETARKARVAAAAQDCSLSKWVSQLVEREVGSSQDRERSWERLAELMEGGFELGGRPLSREEAHER